MKVVIYSRSDAMLILRRDIYAATHRHHAIQVTFAVGEPFEAIIDEQCAQHEALVIDSNYPHHLVGRDEWVITLLLNPQTNFAKAVQHHLLADAPSKSLDAKLSYGI